MGRLSRNRSLLKKAEAALFASIEIYNKVDFPYREESFTVLCTNAWELLLKARILKDNRNKLTSLYVRESAGGRRYKKNRAGAPMTISIGRAIELLRDRKAIDDTVRDNLLALIEIRDSSVHFMNVGDSLRQQVLELGSAAVANFVRLSMKWFGHDLSEHSLYLMPIGFIAPSQRVRGVSCAGNEKRVVDYVSRIVRAQRPESEFSVALDVQVRMARVSGDGNVATYFDSDDPNALSIVLSEEDIRKAFPWSYRDLCAKLRQRFASFKENGEFHAVRKPLMENEKLVRARYLDPGNPRSGKKDFYSPNIMREFEKHYGTGSST